ncbi:GNAT family N-acetyltransferase [Paenibacillus mendelii]|uniref:GNAT family N-acetyltransferase n=1 Tax=Paenibacillus mendelii TaxID=206163 RepID=A0ABV6J4G9_9BACL|nr:GNAT family N-acetyltransferase [Paenibacillus mendelii]MCQ6561701.1 GNAT family N-acetyltransferase [Paenibacillus mendelii]
MSDCNHADAAPYTVTPLDEHLAQQLCEWHYEPPFDFYNWTSWAEMQVEGREFGDPVLRALQYAAVLDREGTFVGFAQFFPLLGVTRLGLGLRPDLCGQGQGLGFITAIVREAQRRAPGDEIDLEVHVWNTRAIKVYENAGFVISDTYERHSTQGIALVHCMTYETPDNPD